MTLATVTAQGARQACLALPDDRDERDDRLRAREARLRERAERLAARDERLRAREERLRVQAELDEWRLMTAVAEAQVEEQAALMRELQRLDGDEFPTGAKDKALAAANAMLAELPAGARKRLTAFPASRLGEIATLVGAAPDAPDTSWWPELAGCLVVLFTARSGSTFLSREIESRFDLGRVGESLNPAQLRARPVGALLTPRADRWFGCKAGVQGVVSGEFAGFFETFVDRCVFLQLVRRDIVAQAVSLDRAERTGGWHEKDEAPLAYDAERIERAINNIVGRVDCLRRWAELTGRPRRTVAYEDVAHGDPTPAIRACLELGAPERPVGDAPELRAVERMGDELNAEWKARFDAEMSPSVRDRIDQYLAAL